MTTFSDSVLSKTLMEAIRQWDAQKLAGATLPERTANLARTLRASWPFTREWKYLCHSCDDYGLVMAECSGDATCGRHKMHLPHGFGTPCWCQIGNRFRVKVKHEADAIEAAAKVKRPSRFGR